ncbi:PREDICTED: uncharacterized protein LOC108763702 [Trachymyrmex cornetzi]|uniref:uncharacterized protein LOC108763702 n=1 Tax=Trachymyrmex cornetzi TaxID=471704 RepID=UPI00084ED6BD|nr:PREDICTED: uncharacterized protein LOC108763702 [Trachymyrmex cornetzi]
MYEVTRTYVRVILKKKKLLASVAAQSALSIRHARVPGAAGASRNPKPERVRKNGQRRRKRETGGSRKGQCAHFITSGENSKTSNMADPSNEPASSSGVAEQIAATAILARHKCGRPPKRRLCLTSPKLHPIHTASTILPKEVRPSRLKAADTSH